MMDAMQIAVNALPSEGGTIKLEAGKFIRKDHNPGNIINEN